MSRPKMKIYELGVILLLTFFLVLFLVKLKLFSVIFLISLPEVIWNHRVIESLSQAVLIFAAVVGILALEKR